MHLFQSPPGGGSKPNPVTTEPADPPTSSKASDESKCYLYSASILKIRIMFSPKGGNKFHLWVNLAFMF